MKLVIAIIRDVDRSNVVEALISHGHRVTHVASTGGFLRRGNVTLFVGAEEEHVESVIEVLRETCSPAEPDHSRATIFVVDAPHFEQI